MTVVFWSKSEDRPMLTRPEPYESPQVPAGWRWRPDPVEYHGAGEFDRLFVYPGRMVLEIPGREWPAARPEECADASGKGEWVDDGKILVCPGCGLDCT